jgi:outer membrane protein OmpA-like peptidoglycan-associated protein
MKLLTVLFPCSARQSATIDRSVRIGASVILQWIAVSLACVVGGCTTAPAVSNGHASSPVILPGKTGFVICSNCEQFQPTTKGLAAPKQPGEKRHDPPVAESLAANEEVLPDRLLPHSATPKSIKVFFKINDAKLSATETQKVRSFVATLDASVALSVTGYSDGSGKRAANRLLADRRAEATKDLIGEFKPSHKVSISHIDKCCPNSPDATEAERTANRRVEITVIP